MNKYVKVSVQLGDGRWEKHPNWFLVFEKGMESFELDLKMSERLIRKVVGGIHNPNPIPNQQSAYEEIQRRVEVLARGINYSEIVEKYDHPIIIRPSGTYMPFGIDGIRLENTMYSDDFPYEDEAAEVVICENDDSVTDERLHWFQRHYPKKSIGVISYFDTTSDEVIKKCFKKAEYVVFSTTFSSMDWWEKLVKNLHPHNKVEGQSSNEEGWKEAESIYPKVKRI